MGPSKLAAVNRLSVMANAGTISALPSTGTWPNLNYGTTPASQYERLLDDEMSVVMTELADGPNTDFLRSYTANGSGEVVFTSVDPTVVKVWGTGLFERHRLTIRGGKLYDQVRGTVDFGAAAVVTLRVARSMPYDELDPVLKSYVLARAALQVLMTERAGDERLPFMAAEVNRLALLVGASQMSVPLRRPDPGPVVQGGQ